MDIGLIFYNPTENKICLKKVDENIFDIIKFEKEDFINQVENKFSISIDENKLSEVFNLNNTKYFLCDLDTLNAKNIEWVNLSELISESFINDDEKRKILNYFYRLNKLKKEKLFIDLKSEDIDKQEKLEKFILKKNKGISSDVSSNKEIIISNSNNEINALNIDIDKYSADSLEDLYQFAMEEIYQEFINIVSLNTNFSTATYYGLTGLTESGKSYYSSQLDKNFNYWNLKIRYFIEETKLLIDEEQSKLLELYAINLMLDFSIFHYYKDAFAVESVYSLNFHTQLKEVFGENYNLIFIDVPENIRINRSEDAIETLKRKDIKKKAYGIDKLVEEADLIVDNSKTVVYSNEQIENFIKCKGVL